MATLAARADLLETYARAHQKLIAALVKYPRPMWDYKPSPRQWSVREIIVHLADAEVNGYIRCRRIIAEPGLPIFAYDQDKWNDTLAYAAQDPDDALELFRLLRKMTYTLLRRQPEAAWSRTLEHPEAGTVTLERWLEIYAQHAETHLAQLQRVFTAWQATQQQVQQMQQQQ